LLRAYPGRFRRRHGTELVTTMLEMAEPGRRRPATADVRDLLAGALRAHFRLPAGRPFALIAAVLVTLALGGFGAAAGSWLAERTFAGIPGPNAMADLAADLVGRGADTRVDGTPSSAAMSTAHVDAPPGWSAAKARGRLGAAGWHVSDLQPTSGYAGGYDPVTGAPVELPTTNIRFTAERGGVHLQVDAHLVEPDIAPNTVSSAGGSVAFKAWAADVGWLRPLVAIGGGTGLIAGWLLAAALADRAAGRPRTRRRIAAGLAGIALLTWVLPVVALYSNAVRAFLPAPGDAPAVTVHSALTAGPLGYYSSGPVWLVPVLALAGVAAGVLAAVLLIPAAAGEAEPVAMRPIR
jgi:hypothetical protein